MSSKVLEATVSELPTKQELREVVYTELNREDRQELREAVVCTDLDIEMDGRVVGAVFGDADRAPGSQNTLQHNGPAQPKDIPDLIKKNQVPAQVMSLFGLVDGAVLLADSWIDHGNRETDGLTDIEKRTLIDKAIEKYAFNMTVCEAAAVQAITENTDLEEQPRSLEKMLSDESDNIDVRFKNGETLQVKAGRAKYQGCDLKAKVTEDGDELKVEVWRK